MVSRSLPDCLFTGTKVLALSDCLFNAFNSCNSCSADCLFTSTKALALLVLKYLLY